MKSSVSVELFCTQCNNFTEHVVSYKNERMESITCQQCNRTTVIWYDKTIPPDGEKAKQHIHHHHLSKLYSQEFLNRIMTKPKRMEKELVNDLSVFLVTLPLRIITKPVRLLKETFLFEDDEDQKRS